MRSPLLLLCGLLIVGCSMEGVSTDSTEIIHRDSDHVLELTTYHRNGEMMKLPIWTVYKSGGESKQALLTVLRVFQESEPGIPTYRDGIITDSRGTYIYDLRKNEFTENRYPDVVYSGEFIDHRK